MNKLHLERLRFQIFDAKQTEAGKTKQNPAKVAKFPQRETCPSSLALHWNIIHL